MVTYDHISANKRKTALLITGFLVFIIALGWLFAQVLETPIILLVAVAFSTIMALISYFYSDKIVLKMSKAREVTRESNRELYRLVENLTIAAGLPMPKIYVIEDQAMNAFATGRNPENGVIAFTTGLLQKLDKAEIEGVAAHELAHIGNYDIRLSTIVVILVGIVALLSDFFLRLTFWGGRSRSNNQGGAIMLIVGLLAAILAPIAAMLIQMAVSRKREYLADATAAMITRYPEGLARALRKISGDHTPLRSANSATAHMYIINPLKELRGKKASSFAKMFSTHPPAEERIKKLEQMNL